MHSMARIIKPSFEHKDERGVFREVATGNWKAVNYAERKKGSIIGNHYHKKLSEMILLVTGSADVTLKNVNTGKSETFKLKAGECFAVSPFEAHALVIEEDAKMVMFLTETFDPGNKDLYDFEIIKKN